MSASRLFDFAHLTLQKSPNESALVTKYKGVWEKTSSQELVNKGTVTAGDNTRTVTTAGTGRIGTEKNETAQADK